MDAERDKQPPFSKAALAGSLAVGLLVLAGHALIPDNPDRLPGPRRTAALRFDAIELEVAQDPRLRVVGAWRMTVADPRFGGLSALAIDGGELVALSDSGVVIRFPPPGVPNPRAVIADLPAGPGSARFKKNRDSEALARDALGRGWWVAFENGHELWLYDPRFRRPLDRIRLGRRRWLPNVGAEAMVADGLGLWLVPEIGTTAVRVSAGRIVTQRLEGGAGWISDAARLPEGSVMLLVRSPAATGLRKALVPFVVRGGRPALGDAIPLALGALDNAEGLAAERAPNGGTRLWLVTDNDFRNGKPTLLVAIDLAAKA